MFHLTFITHDLTAYFIHNHLLVLLVTNHVPLPCLWSNHSIIPRSTRSFQRSRSRQAEETTLSSSSLFFEQWNKQIPLNLCLFKMIVLIFYHSKLPLNHPLWENVMFLLFPKTTFKQIQVDGRFQTCFFHGVFTPKNGGKRSRLTEAEFFFSDGSWIMFGFKWCLFTPNLMWQFDVAICSFFCWYTWNLNHHFF